jgi:hypothetical protein
MIIQEDDKTTIEQLRLISGIDEDIIRRVFEAFILQFTFDFTNKKSIHIPFVGNFMVRYKGDKVDVDGKEAVLDAFYAPHDEIKRVVGQLVDAQTSENYSEVDSFNILKKILRIDFKTTIESED